MNKIITWVIGGVAVLALIIGSVALVGSQSSSQGIQDTSVFGASTPGTRFPHGITIGLPQNSPTNIGDIKAGTCALSNLGTTGQGIDVSQAASTTQRYSCAVTGVISTDIVIIANIATSSIETVNGWAIVGAIASSTSGYIDVILSNLTGTAKVPSAQGVGSSTPYIVIKTQ